MVNGWDTPSCLRLPQVIYLLILIFRKLCSKYRLNSMWPVADVKRNGVGKHDGDDPVDLDPLPRWKPVFIGAVVVWPKCQWPSWCDRRARKQLLAQPASGLLVRELVDVCDLGRNQHQHRHGRRQRTEQHAHRDGHGKVDRDHAAGGAGTYLRLGLVRSH